MRLSALFTLLLVPAAVSCQDIPTYEIDTREVRSVAAFDKGVVAAKRNCIVYFGAEWCGPCGKMHPIVNSVATARPHVDFLKVDFDKLPELGQRYGVENLPAYLVFRNGKPLFVKTGDDDDDRKQVRIVGSQSEEAFAAFVDRWFPTRVASR